MTTSRNMLKEALVAIERLQAKLADAKKAQMEPIAIVGCGMRYPGGVNSLDDMQALLSGKVNAVRTVPADRWDAEAYYSPDQEAAGKIVTKKGGFLDRIDQFDPQFFGISPREAKSLDPQQRLLLETAHEAMESAGIATDQLEGSSTGVFVGISTTEYGRLMWASGAEQSDVYSATGGAMNSAPGRISFTYGFLGPSAAVDTACSSSLNAIHLACQSLRNGESDLALAGGVAIIAMPDAMAMFSRWGMLSPDGACKTFDASANGFARGEGCAMIALKRLSDAEKDGNPILGLVVGSATNSDGRSSGMTVPSGPAQEHMLRTALASAQLGPLDIDYIEAHGTGTPIGDPIEAGALGAVLCAGRAPSEPLRIGSIKTNLGHTEAASGIAGLLKVLACFRAESIFPQLHFISPNPGIDWADLPLEVVTEAAPWPRRDTPRRAGVSAFGFSGTNVHAILADAPRYKRSNSGSDRTSIIPLSAETPTALRQLAARYRDFVSSDNSPALSDVAKTLSVGRSHRTHRAALVVSDTQDLREKLTALANGEQVPGISSGRAGGGRLPRIAFLCTGQGAQYPGMTRGLYESEPVFAASIDESARILKDVIELPLQDVLYPKDDATSLISETAYTQPALFAVEYAMAELWRSWGIEPSIVVGHSIGEYVAACLAGVMSHEDALRLVAERGRLMQHLPTGGAMAAIFAPEDQVAPMLAGIESEIAIAGVNGSEETVISGTLAAVDTVLKAVENKGIMARRLTVSHAFHSPLLDPMLGAFEEAASKFIYRPARIQLISNLTGSAFATGTQPDAAYWRAHARNAVRFGDCVTALEQAGADILIELGPQPALLGLTARARPEAKWKTIPSLRRGQDDAYTALSALAEAYSAGVKVNWKSAYKHRSGHLVPAPTYPFQHDRYWFDAQPNTKRLDVNLFHPILGEVQQVPPPRKAFISTINAQAPSFLADHKILGRVIFPATGYVEMALAAGEALLGKGPLTLSDLSIEAPLELHTTSPCSIHTEVEPSGKDRFVLTIREVLEDAALPWRTLVHAKLSRQPITGNFSVPCAKQAKRECAETLDVAAHYSRLETLGLNYGPIFRGLESLQKGDGIAVGIAVLPDEEKDIANYRFHPALLDNLFHAVSALVPNDGDDQLYLPTGIDNIHWEREAPRRVVVTAKLRKESSNKTELTADLVMETEAGEFIARFEGLRARAVSAAGLSKVLGASKTSLSELELSWEKIPRPDAPVSEDLLIIDRGCDFAASLAQTAGAAIIAPSDLSDTLKTVTPKWIVFCAPFDTVSGIESELFADLLSTVQVLESEKPMCGICVLTKGAKAVAAGDSPILALSALTGLSRTVDAECPATPILQLDLDPHRAAETKDVFDALALAESEPELALRNGDFFAARLTPITKAPSTKEDHRAVIRIEERGDLDRLQLIEEPRTAPGPDEVEILVRAAGLNFRDVLNALGMYPGDAGKLGSECAGTITRVGKNVTKLKEGDAVVALAGDSIASHVTVSQSFVFPKPDSVTFADAVTLPNAYLTAALCFSMAGGIKPKQRVLVHAAAGGVGLAAMRLALNAGAEVIATAGSDEKRAFALSEGATHVFDSRSDSFGDAIEKITDGEGVDLVVNALSGDMIFAGMRVTRAGGAFLEIGKNNIWTPEEAAERAPGVNYHIVDLGEQIIADPDEVRASFQTILEAIDKADLAPLPVQAFSLAEAKDAFRFMANARHMGKVVILPDPEPTQDMTVRSDGAYIVTGGLAGLGLAVAERLAKRGAGELILISRSGDSAESQAKAADLSERYGCVVKAVACDLGNSKSFAEIWNNHVSSGMPLRGIIHAAGVLDDAPVGEQTLERFRTVASPKIGGAKNLLKASRHAPLDWFVLFSSSSAMFGGPGQANYAGANAWLDGLASYGRAAGKPITSIGWGAWGEVGMAARLSDSVRERWERIGLGQIAPEEGLDAMERVVGKGATYAAILNANTALLAAQSTPRIRALFGLGGLETQTQEDTTVSLDHDIIAAPAEERSALIEGFLRSHVGRALGYSASTIDVDKPLSDLGFDSLMAVQVRNAIKAALHVDIGLRDLLSGLTISEVAENLEHNLSLSETEPTAVGDEMEWEEGTL
ncbi:type I polyketide synthase [Hyphomonas oceanitis]|uniref:Beta-ketoacyl synthase n=1 Tax=Hyphomonas oceanitis SCH89 TaxID=1280953 RepID=A0A059G4E9_9PROT|nr:type I polyketide synthase [Hyphomonas oceanitis]KDA01425.1 beta-ketoacyl synthase [Hyphomonas oceanitis SCH89]